MTPVIRLLASIPSVVYGLIGVLVLVPFVGNDLISAGQKESVINVVQLTGAGLLVSVVILTLMITPIMTALITDALGSVPRAWHEGAVALGLNPLRATIAVSMRAIRPAIIAATALATARAIGEAIVLEMVSGGKAFAPKAAGRRDLHLRAADDARRRDHRPGGGPQRAGAALDDLLVRAAADVLGLHAVARLAPRAAAAAQVRAEQLMSGVEPLPPPASWSRRDAGAVGARRCAAGAAATS